jgi:hypothetical protein
MIHARTFGIGLALTSGLGLVGFSQLGRTIPASLKTSLLSAAIFLRRFQTCRPSAPLR